MGIFRAGVRVSRALTPTPACSFSDDEDPRAKKKQKTRKSTEKVSHHSVEKEASDLFQVGDTTCQLPEELFELPHLGEVLSLDTWNNCLSEEERQRLCAHLPVMDHESCRNTLKELFGHQNMYFGSPLEVLWLSLKEGLCDPNVVAARETLKVLQRKEYYHDVRQYHNGMVNSLVEMRDLWSRVPEASLNERLRTWHAWKSSAARVDALDNMKDSAARLHAKQCVEPSGIVDDGATRLPINTAHQLSYNCGDVVTRGSNHNMCNDLEARHDSEDTKIQGALVKEGSHAFISAARLANPQGFNGMKKRSRESRQWMSLEELVTGSPQVSTQQKAQRRIEKHDRHARGQHRHAFSEHEDVQLPSLVKEQRNGCMNKGLKGFEVVARDANAAGKDNNRAFDLPSTSKPKHDQLFNDHAVPIPPLPAGSSFSTLHLLSAVRAVLVDGYIPHREESKWLSFREIVSKVAAHPWDPRILEVQLPLDGLVKGVLKVLSSTSKKHALCKPFVIYDKSIRCWSWIGLVTSCSLAPQGVNMCSFPEIWSTSAETLDEAEEAFVRWLTITEKTLHQLWQLALLPVPACPIFPDEQERFRDLRAQKSLTTIFPSSYELRALFRKEECVRYSALEISFRYTAADGRKSAVAPLRRLGGKTNAKARDHFMLKQDRPSHITVLCLVRDAAARLPQGIGTRADVCILLRDSQFIVEDVPELQLSQVVSGALDRLHYERDPCVRYDSDKKLWLYLHGDREEEDFEEGGTTSTRSSRRSKKDGAALRAQGNGYNDDMSEPEPDSGSLNGNVGGRESASPELLYEGGPAPLVHAPVRGGPARDEVLLPFINVPASMQPFCGNMQSHPMGWEVYKAGKGLSITQ